MPEPNFIGIDPHDLSTREAHQLLLHCVAPRPIAFVSTLSKDGLPNLAPFSYFMAGGANPPSIIFSPTTDRHGGYKDTLRNIQETHEFTINVVTYAIREKMNITSSEFPYGVSEWEEAGFTASPGVKVATPHAAESPLAIECKLYQIVSHGDGPTSANYVIGEVVYFHVSSEIMENGILHPERIDYIARMGGDWYSRASSEAMFTLPRP